MIYDWARGSFASDEFIIEYTGKEYVPPPLQCSKWVHNYSNEQVLEFPDATPYIPPPVKGAWSNNYGFGQEWINFGRDSGIATGGGGPTYYGIFKRYTGATWVKEPLKVYVGGSWQLKPTYRWDGSSWKLIDTAG